MADGVVGKCDGCQLVSELMAELDILRRRSSEMSQLEERCRRAEEALKAHEERSRLWRESAPMGVCATDGNGRIAAINRKMKEMLSLPPIHDENDDNDSQASDLLESSMGEALRLCLETKKPLVVEQFQPNSKEGPKSLRYHLSPVSDGGGAALGVIAFGEDITPLHRAEQALRESEERYRLLFESSPIAMIERDASTLKAHIEQLSDSGVTDLGDYVLKDPEEIDRCMSMIKTVKHNVAFLELMEISDDTAFARGLDMASFKDAKELGREIILMLARNSTSNEKERTFTTLKGSKKNVLAKTLVVSGHEATFSRIVVALVDITQRKRMEEALRISEQRFRDQAIRDDLTGLYNRRYLYSSLNELISAAKTDDSKVSVIFMDIDHFKVVVDTYGHLNGSQVIRELAGTIRYAVESPAYAVAYAGDEFVIVLPGLDDACAKQKALEIRRLINNAVYLREQGVDVRLSASFGVATFPDHAKDMRDLLSAADQALFCVKQTGKNSVGLHRNHAGNVHSEGLTEDDGGRNATRG